MWRDIYIKLTLSLTDTGPKHLNMERLASSDRGARNEYYRPYCFIT